MSHRLSNILLAALLIVPSAVFAQNPNRSRNPILQPGEGLETSRRELADTHNNKQDKRTEQADVYMFAVSFSLIDSVMYVSDIQFMRDETLNNNWFLKNRQAYENQFSAYVTGGNDDSQLAYLYFSEKEKTVVRKSERLVKRNNKKNKFPVTHVGSGNFAFTKVE